MPTGRWGDAQRRCWATRSPSQALSRGGYLLIGRRVRAKLSLVPYIAAVYGTAAVVMLGLVGLARQTFAGYTPATYGWLLLLALVPQLIGTRRLTGRWLTCPPRSSRLPRW